MKSCLVRTSNVLRRILFVAALISVLPAWTCSGIIQFNGCNDAVQPQINAISPQSISADTTSTLFTVDGSGLASRSEILWNGHALQTIFVDSRHLQATATQHTFEFGGSAGSSVFISVHTLSSSSFSDCANGATSAEVTLTID